MQIQAYNSPLEERTLVLQYSSYAEKDIQASVDLTIKFLSSLQRWHAYRSLNGPTRMGTSTIVPTHALVRVYWLLAKALADTTGGYSSPNRLKRYTVIRSAFVYKKTREQFGLRMRTYRFQFRLTKLLQNVFLTWLSQLQLPAELTVRVY